MKYRKWVLLLAVLALASAFGLAEEEIDRLAVLDVKDSSYFKGTGITYQHGGGYLFCRDKAVMGWLFEHERN